MEHQSPSNKRTNKLNGATSNTYTPLETAFETSRRASLVTASWVDNSLLNDSAAFEKTATKWVVTTRWFGKKTWNEKPEHLHSRTWNITVCARQEKKKPLALHIDLPNWKDEPPQPNARALTRTVTQPTTPGTLAHNFPGRGHLNTKKPNCGFGHATNRTFGCAIACRTPQHRHIELRTTIIENGELQNRNDRLSDMVQQENDRMPGTESPYANAIAKAMSSHLRPIDNAQVKVHRMFNGNVVLPSTSYA